MLNEPLTGARVPEQSDGPLGGVQISNAARDLAGFTVPRFSTNTARDAAYAAWVTSGKTMANGLLCTVGGRPQQYRGSTWHTIGIVKARRTAVSASGSLAAGGTASLVPSTTLPAAPFGTGINYMLQVISQVECVVSSGGGARIRSTIGGIEYRSDQQGNAATASETITLHGNEMSLITSDAAQTVHVELDAITKSLTVNTTGGEVIIIAAPYEAL